MDTHEFAKAILEDKGMTFDDVDLLVEVLRKKRERISRQQKLKVGDRIVLRNIKPKYMTGQPATITGQANGKIEILLDAPVGRFGRKLLVHRTCIEVIESQEG